MKLKRVNQEWCNRIFPLIGIVLIFIVVGLAFDYYYDLNDDVVIKDILSGALAGHPDGHTNQILFPLGGFLSFWYRLFPHVPVYGLFLLGCYGLSFYCIGIRSLQGYQKVGGKFLLLLVEAGIFLSVFLWEFVYVQYSVVCGFLAGTACFWFYTTKQGLGIKEFWLSNLPALLLVWLAFLLRSEMLMLVFPFFAVVGIYHWYDATMDGERKEEKDWLKLFKQIFSKQNSLQYIGFVVVTVVGFLVFWGMDNFAYRSNDWKEYRRFFDARTRVYDYTWYPAYEEQQRFYEELGVTREQVGLIDHYNFGLDTEIDAEVLEKIANFEERAKKQGSLGNRLKNSLWEMGYRMISPQDAPYNYVLLLAYGLVIALAIIQKDKSCIWRLLLLMVMRMIPWMYLLLADRVVARIAHPLYFVELLILLGLLVKELKDRPLWNLEQYYRLIAIGILAVSLAGGFFFVFPKVKEEQKRRQKVNETIEEFRLYAARYPENYYLMDVYSTVNFSEKIFASGRNEYKNYDLLGGWIFHSPLLSDKFSRYSQDKGLTLAKALLTEGFYLVVEATGDRENIKQWYASLGIDLDMVELMRIGKGEDPLVIYQLEEKKE